MSPRLTRGRRRLAALAVAVTAGLATAGGLLATGSASAGTLSGSLYVEPGTSAARWVAANPNDSRAPVIRDKIASQPEAHWISSFNLSTVQSEVSTYVGGANAAGKVPVLSIYGITNRDCGGASAGGAPDLGQYQTWISDISRGLGSQTVVIILETDSLALQTCLSGNDLTARDNALSTATQTLKAGNANAKVYLDGGHSAWNSASEQANRLKAAGVQFADGFFTNVSNFNPTSSEAAYGRNIISALSGMGVPGKHQIIDTSRNGGASGDWCADDNTDRRIGTYPTLSTGDANIDGYLWVKPPGEADGCKYAAGQFVPDLAFSLANGAPNPPTTGPATSAPPTSASPTSASPTAVPPTSTSPTAVPPTSTSPTAVPPTSTGPTSAPPPTGCAATYQTVSSWGGGFQAQVTVTAGGAAINGWTVTWTLASGQTISQLWNGTLTTAGSAVTVRNVSWNGALAARATASFGFIGNGPASAPAVTCTAG